MMFGEEYKFVEQTGGKKVNPIGETSPGNFPILLLRAWVWV
jgi:hypothetical protein